MILVAFLLGLLAYALLGLAIVLLAQRHGAVIWRFVV